MNIIWALDCAFCFFQNYPPRLSMAELDIDLPCIEQIYSSKNPFTEPNFRFSRDLTLRQGLEALFSNGLADPGNPKRPIIPMRELGFTVMDMFVLIHGTLICVLTTPQDHG